MAGMHSLGVDATEHEQTGSINTVYTEDPPSLLTEGPLEMQNPFTSDLQPSTLRQMAYDSNYTEDINLKMRIPTKLTVVSQHDEDDILMSTRSSNRDIMYKMEVPDRIVVSVGEDGVEYGGAQTVGNTLIAEDFLRDDAAERLSLTTPPRKLTLAERNLDTLDISDHPDSEYTEKDRKKKPPMSGDRIIPEVQHNDSSEEADEISLLRRQVFKLHRRITAIEKQEAERSKKDLYVYAVTVAFWVLNGWFLYSSRRPY